MHSDGFHELRQGDRKQLLNRYRVLLWSNGTVLE